MPELPEVETYRRSLEKNLLDHRIEDIEIVDDKKVFAGKSKASIKKALLGAKIKSCKRKGKYLWLELNRKPWPVFHLGMTGNYTVTDEKPSKNTKSIKLILKLDNGKLMIFRDPRRFGRMFLKEDPLHEAPLMKLGPDVMNELPDANELYEEIQKRKAPIKAVLLDQSFLSGIGNWMSDEILFQSGIDPHRKAATLTRKEVKKLHSKIHSVTSLAVKVGADDEKYPENWLFHHRWARVKGSIKSGEKIQHDTVGGRSTSWVPEKQK